MAVQAPDSMTVGYVLYGASPADALVSVAPAPDFTLSAAPTATLTVHTEQTDASRVTDLLDFSGNPRTDVVADDAGNFRFYAPAGLGSLYVTADGLTYFVVHPADVGTVAQQASAAAPKAELAQSQAAAAATSAEEAVRIATAAASYRPTKADVGLGSVDDVSAANLPLSIASVAALGLKAPVDSPQFTGTVSGSGFVAGVDDRIAIERAGQRFVEPMHLTLQAVGGAITGPMDGKATLRVEAESALQTIRFESSIAVATAPLVFDVLRDGVSIFPSAAGRPSIPVGGTTVLLIPEAVLYEGGASVTVDLVSGTIPAGESVTGALRMRRMLASTPSVPVEEEPDPATTNPADSDPSTPLPPVATVSGMTVLLEINHTGIVSTAPYGGQNCYASTDGGRTFPTYVGFAGPSLNTITWTAPASGTYVFRTRAKANTTPATFSNDSIGDPVVVGEATAPTSDATDPVGLVNVPSGWQRVFRHDGTDLTGINAYQSSATANSGLSPTDTSNSLLQKPTRRDWVTVVNAPGAFGGKAINWPSKIGTYETNTGTVTGWVNCRGHYGPTGIPPVVLVRFRFRYAQTSRRQKVAIMWWPDKLASGNTWPWEVDIMETFGGSTLTDSWGSKQLWGYRPHKDQAGDADALAQEQKVLDFPHDLLTWSTGELLIDWPNQTMKLWADGVLVDNPFQHDPNWIPDTPGFFSIGRALTNRRDAVHDNDDLWIDWVEFWRPGV